MPFPTRTLVLFSAATLAGFIGFRLAFRRGTAPAKAIGMTFSIHVTPELMELIHAGSKTEAVKLYQGLNPETNLLVAIYAVEQIERMSGNLS